MEQVKAKFKFVGYRISHSELNLSENTSDNMEFGIGIKAKGKIDGECFHLELNTTVSSKDESVQANVIMIGEFLFDKEISKDMLGGMFSVNAPAIMFPYVRAYISTLTALSGIDAVIVPTIMTAPLRDEILESLKE